MDKNYMICGVCGAKDTELEWDPVAKRYYCVDEHTCVERFIAKTFGKKPQAVKP